MKMDLTSDVFFSYATEDLNSVKLLRDKLKKYGIEGFIADENLERGKEGWEETIKSKML